MGCRNKFGKLFDFILDIIQNIISEKEPALETQIEIPNKNKKFCV